MKTIAVFFVVACLVALAALAWPRLPFAQQAPEVMPGVHDETRAKHADEFIALLDAGKWNEARAMTSAELSAAMSAEQLQQVWEGLAAQMGPRKQRHPARPEQMGGYQMMTFPIEYASAVLDVRVIFDADGKISGLRVAPGAAPTTPAAPPAPEGAAYREEPAVVGDGDRALAATLTWPKTEPPFPAVVFVHGSGPMDRDETVGRIKPFRDLAHRLAARGIASLRYDKRTLSHPHEFIGGDFDIDDETTTDAVAAVKVLLDRADVSQVYLVGHSQGAMMAPRIAMRVPNLAGLVYLAAPARPLDELLLAQLRWLAERDGSVSEDERHSLESTRQAAQRLAALDAGDDAAELPLGLPARYWLNLRTYDAVAESKKLPQRILVLQGGRDFQVTQAEDFSRWRAAFEGDARVTLRVLPALNHLFVAGTGPASPDEYLGDGVVADEVPEAIAAWIRQG